MAFPKIPRYQVLGRLAVGGMAEVYLGRSLGFGGFEKLVVLKTILPNLLTNPTFVQMFINEARIAAMLNHPNCVQIFELGKEGEQLYIAMEYIEGFSFSRVLKRAKEQHLAIPLKVHARVASDALSGLEYAHRLTDREGRPVGLIHRDVSPDNLLLSFSGQTKLVDFGIAKASLTAAQQTRAGVVKGKFGYIAPEYLRGLPIDGRADLFALGVVMYRALTGKRPFVGPSEAAVSLAVLRDTPPWPSDVNPALPQALSAVVMKALEKDPAVRFASAKAMRQALEAAERPADPEDVGAMLGQLWPVGDAERIAVESLAGGRSEETSEPVLESIVSTGIELPGVLRTPGPSEVARATGPHASVLAAEPDSQQRTQIVAPKHTAPALLGAEPGTVPHVKVTAKAAPHEDDDDEQQPSGTRKWVLMLLLIALAGGYAAWKMKMLPLLEPAPAPAPAVSAVVETPKAPPPPVEAPPPPPPVAVATKGTLAVEVDVPLSVLLDGRELGKSPGTFELEPGAKKVTLKGGTIDQAFDVEVVAGQTAKISELRKGTLSVKAAPWAYVKIDGKAAGQTPVRRELYEGAHSVELSNSELNVTKRVEVRVKSGETKSVNVNLDD